ncbi:hypothetical protein ACP4OV_013561 [Aristida adscensionis]
MSMAPLPCSALLRRVVGSFLAVLSVLAPARLHARPLPVGANLTVGTSLKPHDYITSPSGDFAFGLRALDTDPTMFFLATWFRFAGDGDGDGGGDPSTSQAQSVVWFAKESTAGRGVLATAQCELSFTADGMVKLTDGGSEAAALWIIPMFFMKTGSVLTLLDSGEVQFLDANNTLQWSSFWLPADTLLPGQPLVRYILYEGILFSKRGDTEFTAGRYSLRVQDNGNVVLYADLLTDESPKLTDLQYVYWELNSTNPNGTSTIRLDDHGGLNCQPNGGTVQTLIRPASSAAGEYFRFARLDPDGIVRAYARPKNGGRNASWTVTGAFPRDGCTKRTPGLLGTCGPGSYCVDTNDRLNCLCPRGYTYIDPQHNDGGCTPEFAPHSCGGGGDSSAGEFALEELPNTTWESTIYYKRMSSVTEEQCRSACLSDCFCAAALMIGGADCVEVAVLANGRHDTTTKALIKVRTRDPPARTRIPLAYRAISTLLACLLPLTVGGFLAWNYLAGRSRERRRLLSPSVRAFTWKELHHATNGFEKLLGKGSFGEVYQGKIRSPGEPRLIAVKKLIDSNLYTETEFTNEVQSIGQIHHRNLVRMIGYCKEGKHRMLVFEFMPGGSLRRFLFDPERRPPWRWRAEAALAIARGIEYLHDGCAAPIIHCDIKPDNILLDDRHVPRITDFGISKLLGSQQVHATVTHVRGTRGYIAPEWLRGDGRVDTKADVYSFGVVLLEMICCRKCQDPVAQDGGDGDGGGDEETVTLFGWAAQLVGARRTTELMLHRDDGADAEAMEEPERVERFARVALWCVDPNPALRPSMHRVVQLLEMTAGDQDQLQVPPDPPGCYMDSSPLLMQQ